MLATCAKCLTALAVTIGCGLGLALSSASAARHGCGDATTAADRLPPATARSAVRCLINEARTSHGLPPLQGSRRLTRSAQSWVNKLVAADVFGHGDLAGRVLAAGVKFASAGEDLGTGQATPSQIVRTWLSDVPHCRNILDPVFSEIGTGVNPHAIKGWATGPSTWAVDFALPLGHRSPSGNWGPANRCPLY